MWLFRHKRWNSNKIKNNINQLLQPVVKRLSGREGGKDCSQGLLNIYSDFLNKFSINKYIITHSPT